MEGKNKLNDAAIRQILQFNRYYTVWLEVMNKGYPGTDFSWPESRVLFEIYGNDGINATELCEHLHMDKSYVSRILTKFEKHGLLTRTRISGVRGIKRLQLTAAGNRETMRINQNGDKQISEKLNAMDEESCGRLCEAMAVIEELLRQADTAAPKQKSLCTGKEIP